MIYVFTATYGEKIRLIRTIVRFIISVTNGRTFHGRTYAITKSSCFKRQD